MKKLVLFLNLCILFFGCRFAYEPEELSTAPTVRFNDNSSDKSIAISIPKKITAAKYINVYRQDVTGVQKESETKTEEAEIENIGILYPKFITEQGSAFIFFDSYIIKGHKYKYRVRYADSDDYTDSDDYVYSNWSQEIAANYGYEENAILEYAPSENAGFSYNKDLFVLTIRGTFTPPVVVENFEKKFKPMMIVKIKSQEKTQVFPIDFSKPEIQLRGFLPKDFLDTDIEIVGIVPQENIYVKKDSDEQNAPENEADGDAEKMKIRDIKEIHWLKYTKITLKSAESFTVPSSAQSDGFDYSKKAY